MVFNEFDLFEEHVVLIQQDIVRIRLYHVQYAVLPDPVVPLHIAKETRKVGDMMS